MASVLVLPCYHDSRSFILSVYLYMFTIMNQRNGELRHIARCTDSRMRLVEKCFDAMACAGKEAV